MKLRKILRKPQLMKSRTVCSQVRKCPTKYKDLGNLQLLQNLRTQLIQIVLEDPKPLPDKLIF